MSLTLPSRGARGHIRQEGHKIKWPPCTRSVTGASWVLRRVREARGLDEQNPEVCEGVSVSFQFCCSEPAGACVSPRAGGWAAVTGRTGAGPARGPLPWTTPRLLAQVWLPHTGLSTVTGQPAFTVTAQAWPAPSPQACPPTVGLFPEKGGTVVS